jgi:hypothetical protein
VSGRDPAGEEITAARLDRELSELLQELRVAQNGVLLLVGFLLVIPFSTRYRQVTHFERDVYYVTFVTAGMASLMIMGPVVYHRLIFRRHQKQALVEHANMMAIAGLVLLSFAILGVLLLVTQFVFATAALTIVMGSLYVVAVTFLWFTVPMQTRRRGQRPAGGTDAIARGA